MLFLEQFNDINMNKKKFNLCDYDAYSIFYSAVILRKSGMY